MQIEIEQEGVIVEAELRDGTFTLGGAARDHVRVTTLPPGVLRLRVEGDRLIISASCALYVAEAAIGPRVTRLVLPGEWIEFLEGVRVRRTPDAASPPPATRAVLCDLLGDEAAPSATPAAPELIAVTGLDLGRTFPLVDGANRIGRGEQVTIRIRDRSVSREHAELTWGADGAFVADLGTSNGTFVNSGRIGTPTRLANGDIIELGRTMLKVLLPPSAERAPPQPGTAEALAQQPTRVKPSPPVQRRSRRYDWTVVGVGVVTALVGLALSYGVAS